MAASVKDKKVSDLTVGELQEVIRQTISEMVDPDCGLELRPEVTKALEASLQSKERFASDDVAKELGLKW